MRDSSSGAARNYTTLTSKQRAWSAGAGGLQVPSKGRRCGPLGGHVGGRSGATPREVQPCMTESTVTPVVVPLRMQPPSVHTLHAQVP